ncbi:MAG: DUF4761 family protein [Klebsiella huaxiensis]|uniref:DUF4761 family protein n=1 Tax=Klebsiella huaxiensis TaxID=2153354 RepID=UPI0026EFEC18|nr:DUF4761 family protein [Klebsiella huaxiensis]WEJ88453.1 MAG: DUF4761 family protein [Klebsiella huaxiensis]
MNKRYSQYSQYAGSIHGITQVSKNTFVYRGFTIRKTPPNAFNSRQLYLVNKRDEVAGVDNYYGRDFALSEARKTIDRIISRGCFIAL